MPTGRRRRPERGLPRRVARGEGDPLRPSFPRPERRLQLSCKRRTPAGPRKTPKLCPPSRRPGPRLRSAPACNPHRAPTAAPAQPPLRSARVYLRPRSRRLLRRRRPHCRSLGPRHATAKLPNKDSCGCFGVFRGPLGRRLCRPGREAAAAKRADPGCAAPRGLRHRCSPSPRLVWPPPSLLLHSLPPSAPLSRAATVDTLR